MLHFLGGVNTEHSADFEVNASWPGYTLAMCFRTPAEILTADGTERLSPGDVLIQRSGTQAIHRSIPGREPFRNDWGCIPDRFFAEMQSPVLPENRLIHTGQPMLLAPYIQHFLDHGDLRDPLNLAYMQHLTSAMCIVIFQAHLRWQKLTEEGHAAREHFRAIDAVRGAIRQNPAQPLILKDAAGNCSLSVERFTVLYRRYFGTTPYEDLIDGRILLAKHLLTASSLPVKSVSQECGWSDHHYFSRIFRKKTGMTPLRWRATGAGHHDE